MLAFPFFLVNPFPHSRHSQNEWLSLAGHGARNGTEAQISAGKDDGAGDQGKANAFFHFVNDAVGQDVIFLNEYGLVEHVFHNIRIYTPVFIGLCFGSLNYGKGNRSYRNERRSGQLRCRAFIERTGL